MNHSHIREMSRLISEGLSLGKEDLRVEKMLKEFWSEKIAVIWGVEDVIDRAESKGMSLGRGEAQTILGAILQRHDASVGINWDVLDEYLLDK